MEESISIIVPVYNTSKKLFINCINSLLNQTYKNIEIILVDDGSCSGIEICCDKYANKYENIKVIHKENGGLSSARNAGFLNSNGKYVMFLDSDDWIEKNTCKELIELYCSNEIEIIVFGFVHHFGEKIKKCHISYGDNSVFYIPNRKELIKDALIGNSKLLASSCWKLYDSEFLKENNLLHNEKIKQGAEDLEFIIRVLNRVKCIKFCDKRYYHYIMDSTSITNCFNKNNAYSVQECFIEIGKNLKKMNYSDLYEPFCKRSWYVLCSSIISGFMNPNNTLSYSEKKRECKQYLSTNFSEYILKNVNLKHLDPARLLVYVCCKFNMFFPIYIMAYIRNKQKRR